MFHIVILIFNWLSMIMLCCAVVMDLVKSTKTIDGLESFLVVIMLIAIKLYMINVLYHVLSFK